MKTYGEFILNNRFLVFVALAIFMILSSAGASKLFFDNDYRAFFGSANPQLEAFEELQNTYTKIDNVQFAIVPEANKTAVDAKVLAVVEELTELAWQIPYSIRVDSISNYQHTEVYEDDLIVEDLYSSANELSLEAIQRIKRVVTTEPALTGRLHDADQRATAVSVTIQLPGLDPNEVVEVSEAARKLAQYIEDKYGLEIKLGGIAMFNNAFLEASMNDMMTLVPAMYFVILLVTYLLVRSIYATFAVLLLIVPSIITAMGFGGWIGVGLTPPSASAPTIITTLAVADSIHFLMTYLQKKREGMLNRASILYSISINAKPIFLTSFLSKVLFLIFLIYFSEWALFKVSSEHGYGL